MFLIFDVIYKKVFFNFSKPVFTDDHEYAVMDVIFHDGSAYTSGSTYIFEWNEKHWEIIGKIFGWEKPAENNTIAKDSRNAP